MHIYGIMYIEDKGKFSITKGGNYMTSLTKYDLDYINAFYEKDGAIRVRNVDKGERICIIAIPVIDAQEDITDNRKTIIIPVYYDYDGEDIDIYGVPEMLDNNDTLEIIEAIEEEYQ